MSETKSFMIAPSSRLSHFRQPVLVAIFLSLTFTYLIAQIPQSVPTETTTRIPELQGGRRCCGPGCREREDVTAVKFYDKKYFDWQTKLGKEKANANDWDKLLGTKPDDVVADLGAGGGHILAVLNVSRRIAVEINGQARKAIEMLYPGQMEIYTYPEEVADDSIDLLYTTSAIEHFECPVTELREMARKVKVGGRVVVGIKNEGVAYSSPLNTNDKNHHLFTWGRQELFNLVQAAGFEVHTVDPPLEQAKAIGSKWKEPSDFGNYNVFIYHWARGTKKA